MRGRARAFLAVSLLSAACAGPPSPRQLKSTAETAASWAASLRWSVEAWSAGRVTRPFLRASLDQARQALDAQARQLRGRPSAPGLDVGRAASLLDRESALASALAGDVQRSDAAATLAHARELDGVERELRGLAAALGS
jgi:hypothetical protein